ncbi:ethanolamine kinase 1-like isoform X2 [Thalassophryne amazonica]|uniref:ethanolamine kinase 1-like isoform X2 n=1 Tax=Thalassophryne amazonica TaxID=390379 RepID=UPI001470BAC7|nr:ethanolamine kinase 1-like isoform X2 [Thalassophryne amazonica]
MESGVFVARDPLLHVDVHVDELEPHRGILELLSRLRPHWNAHDIQMKTFTEGITNQLIGCYIGSLQEPGCVLVRLYGQSTELFVNRNREIEMFQIMHSHSCGPEIYCSFHNGICYEFVMGTVLDDELLRQPSIYSVHPVGGVLSFDMLAEMESLRRALSNMGSPIVLCHNDLLTKNIIYNQNQGTVKFIDYEYADYNYQAFDIGNHFNEFAGMECIYSRYPGPDLQRDWLTAYLESYKHSTAREVTVTDGELSQLYIQVCKFSLASNLLWGFWAILQSRFSSIDFDFQRYATARLKYYFEKKEEYFGLGLCDQNNSIVLPESKRSSQ